MGSCYSQRAALASTNLIMASSQSKIPATKSKFGFRPVSLVKKAPSKENVNQGRNGFSNSSENLKRIESYTSESNKDESVKENGGGDSKLRKSSSFGFGRKAPPTTKEKDLINSEIKQNGSAQAKQIRSFKPVVHGLRPPSMSLQKPSEVRGSREKLSPGLTNGENRTKTGTSVLRRSTNSPHSSNEKINESGLKRRSLGFGFKATNMAKSKLANDSTPRGSKESLSNQKAPRTSTENLSAKKCNSKDKLSAKKSNLQYSSKPGLSKKSSGSTENLPVKKPMTLSFEKLSASKKGKGSRESLLKKPISSSREKLSVQKKLSGSKENLLSKRSPRNSKENLSIPKPGSVTKQDTAILRNKDQPNLRYGSKLPSEASTQNRPKSLDITRKLQPRPNVMYGKQRPVSTYSNASSLASPRRSERTISCSSITSTDLMLDADEILSDASPCGTPRDSTFLLEEDPSETLNTTFTVDKTRVEDTSARTTDTSPQTIDKFPQTIDKFPLTMTSPKRDINSNSSTGARITPSVCAINIIESASNVSETEQDVWIKRTDIIDKLPTKQYPGCDESVVCSSPVGRPFDKGTSPCVSPIVEEPVFDVKSQHSNSQPKKLETESISPVEPVVVSPRVRHLSSFSDDEVVPVDVHSYRNMMQELTYTKTMLFKLKRILTTEGAELPLNGLQLCVTPDGKQAQLENELLVEQNSQLKDEVARLKFELAAKDAEMAVFSMNTDTRPVETFNATTQTEKPHNLTADKGMLLRSQSEGDGHSTVIRHSVKENLPERSLKFYFVRKRSESEKSDTGSHKSPSTPTRSLPVGLRRPSGKFYQENMSQSIDDLAEDNVLILSPNSTFSIPNQSPTVSPNSAEFHRLPKPKRLVRLSLNRNK